MCLSAYNVFISNTVFSSRVMGFQAGKQKEDGNYEMFPIPIVTQVYLIIILHFVLACVGG